MKSVNKLTYEIAESREYRGHWHVEAIDDEGRIFVAVFSGPEAENRAAEYADWKNGVRQDVCSLAEGEVSIRWPMSLSQESYDDLTDWLDVMKRKIGRSVTDQYKTPASESDAG